MPKASAEATLKVKIQARALFETGNYTQEEICNTIKKNGGSLTRKTLRAWINEDPDDIWQVRDLAENRIYDAQKIVHKEKILKQFKKEEHKIKDDIIIQQATEDATQEAMVLINLEKERNKLLKDMLESAYVVNQYIVDLVKKGRTAKLIEEDVIFEGRKMKDPETQQALKKQTKTVEEHKIPDVVRAGELLTKQLYGLGFLQSQPAIAIQNNNTQNNQQNAKVNLDDITEEDMQRAFKVVK